MSHLPGDFDWDHFSSNLSSSPTEGRKGSYSNLKLFEFGFELKFIVEMKGKKRINPHTRL